jgi:hypothetical protein
MNGVMNGDKLSLTDTNDLTRQATTVTMQLSPDQYERLFFQPDKAKGDLTRRLGTSLDQQESPYIY